MTNIGFDTTFPRCQMTSHRRIPSRRVVFSVILQHRLDVPATVVPTTRRSKPSAGQMGRHPQVRYRPHEDGDGNRMYSI